MQSTAVEGCSAVLEWPLDRLYQHALVRSVHLLQAQGLQLMQPSMDLVMERFPHLYADVFCCCPAASCVVCNR